MLFCERTASLKVVFVIISALRAAGPSGPARNGGRRKRREDGRELYNRDGRNLAANKRKWTEIGIGARKGAFIVIWRLGGFYLLSRREELPGR